MHGLADPGGQPAVRVGLRPPADRDVRQDGAAPSTASASSSRSTSSSRARGSPATSTLTRPTCQQLVGAVQARSSREKTGAEFPQDPREQLTAAIIAVFSSWNSDRAVLYRRQERIPNDLGTAVNVVAMVFGNTGPDSGTGCASPATRRPAPRASTGTTCRTPRARTSSRGSATPCPWPTWRRSTKPPTTSCWRSWPCSRALPRPVRHRVHHRARHTVDAADPGRQTHRRRGVPDRRPAGGRGLIDADEAVRRVSGASWCS